MKVGAHGRRSLIAPNEGAFSGLVGALVMAQNDERTIRKRFMSLELLRTMGENPANRLPAARAPARLPLPAREREPSWVPAALRHRGDATAQVFKIL